MRSKTLTMTAALLALGLTAAACGGGRLRLGRREERDRADQDLDVQQPRGDRLGQGDGRGWNADHPDEEVTAQEIPAGKTSEEVIGAAITAGNAPCLVFNTAPAAVPQFQKQGGLSRSTTSTEGQLYRGAQSATGPTSTSRRTASSTRSRGSPTR